MSLTEEQLRNYAVFMVYNASLHTLSTVTQTTVTLTNTR